MKQIKFQSRTERVLRTTYIVMYAFWSNTELNPVFQSTGTPVPFRIPAESGRNVPPRCWYTEIPTMASRRRDAIVGISVYQQKCMTRFDGKYVRFMNDAQTPLP